LPRSTSSSTHPLVNSSTTLSYFSGRSRSSRSGRSARPAGFSELVDQDSGSMSDRPPHNPRSLPTGTNHRATGLPNPSPILGDRAARLVDRATGRAGRATACVKGLMGPANRAHKLGDVVYHATAHRPSEKAPPGLE
jgi:hypothetical protein